MKKITLSAIIIFKLLLLCNNSFAQNIFPSTGRAGIYTTSPAASLQVRGGARIETTANYVNIDSATGNLSFAGTSAYRVAGNKYAFQYSGNTNYGLFFNSTNVQYEFRNGSAVPVFSINANTGNSVVNGTIKVGAYTLPATDGTNGQVLKTNGSGTLTWNNDNGGSGSGWSLTGNAGTNSATNFIGTTDVQPLVFKVNNINSGYIGNGSNGNTSLGYLSLFSNTTGYNNTSLGTGSLSGNTTGYSNVAVGSGSLGNNEGNYNTGVGASSLGEGGGGNKNTAVGYAALFSTYFDGNNNTAIGEQTLYSNTHGSNNVAIGSSALYSNITGNYNTANGSGALYNNTTGYSNVAVGASALYKNTTASNQVAIGDSALYNCGDFSLSDNTAVGSKALYSTITGGSNTAIGWRALFSNTSSVNTAIGWRALASNTSGYGNTATGHNALSGNNTGSNNTANGFHALIYNTTGYSNVAVGASALYKNTTASNQVAIGDSALYNCGDFSLSDNTAVGSKALYSTITGGSNTAIGWRALFSNTSSVNTAIGWRALASNTSGYGNTATGHDALSGNYIGSNNTACGVKSDVTVNNLSNASAFGFEAKVNANNKVRIGNGEVTMVESNAGSWTVSDARFKTNIIEGVTGLPFIKLLRPVVYNFDVKKYEEHLMQNFPDSMKAKRMAAMNNSTSKPSQIRQSGFIAQEVELAAKKSGYSFNGVHAPENPTDNWSLSYEKLVVPLVKAVQELSKMNDEKDAKINALETRLSKIEEQLKINASTVSFTDATLEQNIPNPFTNSTTINYTLPQKFSTAQILITDKNGKTLKAVNLPAGRQGISGSGKGSLNLSASTLAGGAYQYSLLIDGKLIATKQMILAR